MAVKGPLLRRAATQDGLWARAIDVVVPTSATSPVKAAEVGSPLRRDSSRVGGKIATAHAVAADAFRTYHAESSKVSSSVLGMAVFHGAEKCVLYLLTGILPPATTPKLASQEQNRTYSFLAVCYLCLWMVPAGMVSKVKQKVMPFKLLVPWAQGLMTAQEMQMPCSLTIPPPPDLVSILI